MASDSYVFLDTMGEVIGLVIKFAEEALYAKDEVLLGAYLRMSSRAMRTALEIYEDRLEQNLAEMKQGEGSENVQPDH